MFSRLAALCLVAATLTQGIIAGPVTSIFVTEPTGVAVSSAVPTTVDSSEPSSIIVSSAVPSESPFPITGSAAPSESPFPGTGSAAPSESPFPGTGSAAPSESPFPITSVAPSESPITITSVAVASSSPVGVASSFFSEPTTVAVSSIGTDACPSFGAPTVTITLTIYPESSAVASGSSSLDQSVGVVTSSAAQVASSSAAQVATSEVVTITATA